MTLPPPRPRVIASLADLRVRLESSLVTPDEIELIGSAVTFTAAFAALKSLGERPSAVSAADIKAIENRAVGLLDEFVAAARRLNFLG